MKAFFSILCLSLLAIASKSSYDSDVHEFLTPKNLKELNIAGPFDQKAAKKTLGEPDLQEDGKDFYKIDGKKYPLSITYGDGQAKKLYIHYVKEKLVLKELVKKLKAKNIPYEVDTSGQTYAIIRVKSLNMVIKAKHGSEHVYSLEKEYK